MDDYITRFKNLLFCQQWTETMRTLADKEREEGTKKPQGPVPLFVRMPMRKQVIMRPGKTKRDHKR